MHCVYSPTFLEWHLHSRWWWCCCWVGIGKEWRGKAVLQLHVAPFLVIRCCYFHFWLPSLFFLSSYSPLSMILTGVTNTLLTTPSLSPWVQDGNGSTCQVKSDTLATLISVFLCIGLVVSYMPQASHPTVDINALQATDNVNVYSIIGLLSTRPVKDSVHGSCYLAWYLPHPASSTSFYCNGMPLFAADPWYVFIGMMAFHGYSYNVGV